MHDARPRQWEDCQQLRHAVPVEAQVVASAEPHAPRPLHEAYESGQCPPVARDTVVSVVTLDLANQGSMLLHNRFMAVRATPEADAPECSAQPSARGSPLNHPVPSE